MNIPFKKKAKKIDRQNVLTVIALLLRSVYIYMTDMISSRVE